MSTTNETEGKNVVTVLLTSIPLILIGFGTLGVLMYFSWQYGWSLGKTQSDSFAMGALHISAELASAVLVGFSAVCAALGGWVWRRRSLIAFLCAIIFAGVSVLNTYGFMSPRIAAVAGHEGVIEAQKHNAEWLKQMAVNPEVAEAVGAAAAECATGRGPRCLAAEARAKFLAEQQGHMGEKLEKQFSKLEKTVSENPDSHAIAVASITGMSVMAAQKLIILVMAAFGQCVKFSCTFFGFKGLAAFLDRRRGTISSSPKGGSGDTGPGAKLSEESKDKQPAREAEIHRLPVRAADQFHAAPKVSSEPARVPPPAPSPSLKPRLSVAEYLATYGGAASQKAIAQALGVSEAKVSRDVKKLKGRGKVEAKRQWRSNQIIPRRNGGVHHVFG